MDELGLTGWELSSVHNPSGASTYQTAYFIFKREIV